MNEPAETEVVQEPQKQEVESPQPVDFSLSIDNIRIGFKDNGQERT
jgi:hypothetical protein